MIFIASGSLCASAQEIIWETLGNRLNDRGNPEFVQRFTLKGDSAIDGFAFFQYNRKYKPVNSQDTFIVVYPNYFYVKSPRFQSLAKGDSVTVDLISAGALQENLNIPRGMHLVKAGKSVPAKNSYRNYIQFPEQWVNPKNGEDFMVYGEDAYKTNEELKARAKVSPYGQIPTLKKVDIKTGKTKVKDLLEKGVKTSRLDNEKIDYWIAEITPEGVTIKTNAEKPELIANRLKRRIAESADENGEVPLAVIEDWTDYPYRGMMLDPGRNFLTKEEVMEYIDYMERYDLNMLHFHVTEDAGWRMEIPSLPELTEVASKRGFTLTDDVPFLKGMYSGDGDPESKSSVANGYYTVQDYIDILKYADSKGVSVIPEFDMPGHSRAAIRAMEWRAKHNGDSTYRLIHDGDTSKYYAPQDFYDNTMNPAIEGPYKFWATVIDDVVDIYNQAGVPLPAIHIGGDEVANGAWSGSDKAQALMQEKGYTTQHELQGYFVERLVDIAKEKGVKLMGWEDVAMNYSPEYDAKVAPQIFGVNSWNESNTPLSKDLARKGYPVVLSNVDLLYFDLHYTGHPEEPGMWWGGVLSDTDPLKATIDILVDEPDLHPNIVGISGHVWGENTLDFPMVERFTFPRILALSERAHNSHATIDEQTYFNNIAASMPEWSEEGIDFFVRQPGIIVEEGMVKMNEPYGIGEIRYTLDGSEPTKDSMLYTAPFKADGKKSVRAKLFVGDSSSVTSIQK